MTLTDPITRLAVQNSLVCACTVLLGCGRSGFDRLTDAGDITGADSFTDAGSPNDASPGADAGPPSGPFGPATIIPALASVYQDDDPDVSSDGLELYFTSDRPGGAGLQDIWRSVRNSRTETWPAPSDVSELNTSEQERSPALSADGLTLWMDRGGEIYVSTRATRNSAWSTPVLTLDDPVFTLGTPAVCDAGRRMYLRINDAAGVWHIAVATRASTTSTWGPTTVVPELDSNLVDSGPDPTEDCGRLYFDSHRTGKGQVFVSDLDVSSSSFGVPAVVVLSVTPQDPSLTADERYIVFASTSAGGMEEIFDASR